jgi:hypothetical protein
METSYSSGFSKQASVLHVAKFKQRDWPTVTSSDREFDESEKKRQNKQADFILRL